MATTALPPVADDDPLEHLLRTPAGRPTTAVDPGRADRPPVLVPAPVPVLAPAASRTPAPAALPVPTAPATPARPRPVRPAAPDRTPGALDRAHRLALADRLHALVLDAEHVRPCDTPPQRAHKRQVRAARGRLADLEHALRSGIPLLARGERLVARLVSHDAIGLYAGADVRAMHDDADAACAALGVVTAFH